MFTGTQGAVTKVLGEELKQTEYDEEKRLHAEISTQDSVPHGAKVQNMLSHFLSSFLFATSRLTDYHSWFVLTRSSGNVYITLTGKGFCSHALQE